MKLVNCQEIERGNTFPISVTSMDKYKSGLYRLRRRKTETNSNITHEPRHIDIRTLKGRIPVIDCWICLLEGLKVL